jgi:hypothetical protein
MLLRKLGAAESRAGRAAALVRLTLPEPPAKGKRSARAHFDFQLDRAKLKPDFDSSWAHFPAQRL